MKRLLTTLFALALTLTGLGLVPDSSAQVISTFDYVFDINNPLPDPAVWAQSGNIGPRGVEGRGLQITDLGEANSLLYSHATPEIGVGTNVTTFRALVRTPQLQDTATIAWSNDVTGFRLILDDSQHQLVLGLGRDPADPGTPKRRVLVVLGATGVPLLPFPWDNGFHNVYELSRLANGDFSLSATNNDPANTAPPLKLTIPAAQLPLSTGAAMVSWGMGTSGGGISEWQETHGVVSASQVDIALDTAKLEIEPGDHGEVEWNGTFTLPAGTTIDPITEGFSMELVSGGATVFEAMIGPGRFVQRPDGGFRFESDRDIAPSLEVRFKPLGGSLWEFRVEAEDFLLAVADRTQATGTLAIGNKVGTQTLALTDKGKEVVFKKP